jgi:hypothetical protein
MFYSDILLFISMSTIYIIKVFIYLCSFRVTLCFTNPDYVLIRVISLPPPPHKLFLIIEGLLYSVAQLSESESNKISRS